MSQNLALPDMLLKMSTLMIVIIVFFIIIIIFSLVYYLRPQSYIDKFNMMFDNFMNTPDNCLSEDVIKSLSLGNVIEVDIGSIETHYKYRIESAGHNRAIIIVVDEKSNAYLNDKHIDKFLKKEDGVCSLVGLSKANSGTELVRVIRSHCTDGKNPRVYIGSKKKIEPVKPVSYDDYLDGI